MFNTPASGMRLNPHEGASRISASTPAHDVGAFHTRRQSIGIAVLLGWIAVSAGLLLPTWRWRSAILDDAYITYRYAENLILGNGLVFNLGERVEGTSSLLWTVLLAAGMQLGLTPDALSQVMATTANLVLALVAYFFARRRLGHSPYWALITPLFMVANLNFVAWAAHGLETCLFALCTTVGLMLAAPNEAGKLPEGARARYGALALCAAIYTRPEGLLYAAIAGIPRVIRFLRSPKLRRDDQIFAFPLLLSVAILFSFRFSYYGEWLPNTFYAKATGGAGNWTDGLWYLKAFWDQSLVYGFAILPLAGLALRVHKGPRPVFLIAILATLFYAGLVGGDAFSGARFILPVLPLLYLLMQDGLVTFLNASPWIRPLAVGFALLLALGTVICTGSPLAAQVQLATSMTRNRVYLGKLLNAITEPGEVISLNTIGALPYFAKRPILDHYGLVDKHIARMPSKAATQGSTGHAKGDGAYILSRAPAYILLRNVWLADVPIEAHRSLHGATEREIWQDPRFQNQYEPVDLKIREDLIFGFYKRIDVSRGRLEARFAKVDLEALGPVDQLQSERGQDLQLYAEGLRWMASGNLEAAIPRFQLALSLYPGSGKYHLALGQCFEQLDQPDEALAHYQVAISHAASTAQAWLGIGNIEFNRERYSQAIRAYRRALLADSSLTMAHYHLAKVLFKEGQYGPAIPVLREGLARAPRHLEMWALLSMAAIHSRQWATARDALEQLQRIAPRHTLTIQLEDWLAERLPEGY